MVINDLGLRVASNSKSGARTTRTRYLHEGKEEQKQNADAGHPAEENGRWAPSIEGSTVTTAASRSSLTIAKIKFRYIVSMLLRSPINA
jgi:hypothetical protein